MRVSAATLQKVLLGTALLLGLVWNLAQASEIKSLRVDAGPAGTRAEIALDKASEYRLIRLSSPERLVVDLPAGRLVKGLSVPSGAGIVTAVRTGHPEPGLTRIVFDLAQSVAVLKPRIESFAEGPRLVLEWPGDGETPRGNAAAATRAGVPAGSLAGSPAGSANAGSSTAVSPPTPAKPSQPDVDASNAATSRLITEIAARTSAMAVPSSGMPATGVPSNGIPSNGMPSNGISSNSTSSNIGGTPAAVRTPVSVASVPATTLPESGSATPSTIAGGTVAKAAAPSAIAPEPGVPLRGQAGMRPLVIAIDAGHGGQDPGATGPSGKREKDVVLQISRELARQINATPGMRAYLVRDADVYVERPQRARRARSAKADMFVSIHADAATNRAANGSSVFTLSTRGASSQYARWAADRENASDLVGGVRLEKGTLSSVLLDLAQTGHMKASQDAARLVLAGLGEVGRNHKRDVEYANFEVLRNADMPAMLVETGFISHPDEERRLSDAAYQRRLARAVLDGISTYFQRQPPPGTLYAARAAAAETSVAASAAAGAGGGSP